ncbi:MAG: sugar-binding transcriptional regulator [Tissierellaceae bacterium]|jgi:central glycolytic genes regulator|nr:sugar-binding transcriptional regulator [Tissierellia bacterium]
METIEILKKMVPEIMDLVEKRYLILRTIYYNEPIGRRTIAHKLGLKERSVRYEANLLSDQGLINIDNMGMYITEDGKELIKSLSGLYGELKGITRIERILEERLKIKRVYIAPGTFLEDQTVIKDMGKIVSQLLDRLIQPKDIIGITGGNTMAAITDEFSDYSKKRDVIVTPARGGLGSDLNTQSNSIAAKLAEHLGGSYRLLYVPDGLDGETFDLILKNKEVKESIDTINKMNVLIFGIGRADTMAERRKLPKEKVDELLSKKAVAEAFGHYFDICGKEIWEYKTIGLSLDKFKSLNNLIGVAGGEEKAEAIIAVSSLNPNMVLVTDEAAARKILEIIN